MITPKSTILVVDDEEFVRDSIVETLMENGYIVDSAESAPIAMKILNESKRTYDLIISDFKMPQVNGIEFLEMVKKANQDIEFIIMTAYGSIEDAVKAIKLGAFEYLTKPVSTESLLVLVEKALEHKKILWERNYYKTQALKEFLDINFIGEDKKIKDIFSLINQISRTDVTVLITGESGTGKELIAKIIYQKSLRAQKPFVVVDCGTLPNNLIESELFGHEKGAYTGAFKQRKGKIELADEGTLFLDEISNMAIDLQSKMLRFLQEKEFTRLGGNDVIEVNTRIIAATNKDLEEEVKKGNFREDLFFRLNVVPIHLPPLRERKKDIKLLINYFINKYSQEMKIGIDKIDEKIYEVFYNYNWPGNVRELENIIKYLIALSNNGNISCNILPEKYYKTVSEETGKNTYRNRISREGKKIRLSLEEIESQYILEILKDTNYNISSARKILGINRVTLYNKIKKYNINIKR